MQSTKKPEEVKHFKDVLNRWLTIALFEETCDDPAKYPPQFTLKPSDTSSLPCLRTLYLEMADPTEFAFAETYLGGWDHWMQIASSWTLKPYVEEWRETLERQRRALLLRKLEEMASGDTPAAQNAAKYLLETTTDFKTTKRGRPSKAEKEAAIAKAARSTSDILKDAERLGIKVIDNHAKDATGS